MPNDGWGQRGPFCRPYIVLTNVELALPPGLDMTLDEPLFLNIVGWLYSLSHPLKVAECMPLLNDDSDSEE